MYLRFIPMVTIMGMIFYLSHQPGDMATWPMLPGIDKIAHAIAYGLLAVSFLYGLQPMANAANRRAMVVIVVLFCLIFGISDEFHQSFIRDRFVSIWDVVADGAGAVLAVVWWLARQAPKRS